MSYGNYNGGQHMPQHFQQGHGGFPQHYGGGSPYGANERGQGWGGGGNGYNQPSGGYEGQHGYRGGQYGELLYSREFAEAVKRVSRETMDELLAQQGYFPGGMQGGMQGGTGGDPVHARYKEVLDEIRDAPSGEQHKLVEARFENLSAEERKLLIAALAPECSTRKLAAKAGLPVERFLELKHGLKYKLKH